MRFLGIVFAFAGYALVYASVAAGGKFATDPWAGLFTDAYADAKIAMPQQQTQSAAPAVTDNPFPLPYLPGVTPPSRKRNQLPHNRNTLIIGQSPFNV